MFSPASFPYVWPASWKDSQRVHMDAPIVALDAAFSNGLEQPMHSSLAVKRKGILTGLFHASQANDELAACSVDQAEQGLVKHLQRSVCTHSR